MKSPLRKRLLRDLRSELGKYLVIFLLLTGTIGFVSGFLVADGSMIQAYNESFARYNVEDGNFRLARRANKAQQGQIEEMGVALYELFYTEQALDNGSTLRIFQNRDQVDLACLMEGVLPTAAGQLAVDRMYADNNGIRVGDTLAAGARQWVVTGLVALPDYSCLFSDNSDSMFDAVRFGVAVAAPQEFAAFDDAELRWNYAWIYETPPGDEAEERELAEALMKGLNREVALEAFIPRYQNQAITFTGEDMGSDRAMMMVLLYILIAIMAFVFSVITSHTIQQEAGVIGTLRASGYTRGELVCHYMSMPMAVTLVSAVVGNVLGYTVFKDLCAKMYYASYSLTTYVTVWNAEAFWMTTLVPVALMVLVNAAMLWGKLRLPALKFLRHDLAEGRQRRALPLPSGLPFFGRFRVRVILQNLGGYVVLFVGILFANVLLMFGLALPMVLNNFAASVQENLLCSYQYLLTMPVGMQGGSHKLESMIELLQFSRAIQTDNPDAEAFSAYALKTLPGQAKTEEVLLYGVQQGSRYLPWGSGEGVLISSAYADKFLLGAGDTITLKEPYEDTTYTFAIGGVYPYDAALAVFMEQEQLNRLFDLGEGYFCGYLSDTEITDIDEVYIGSVIDLESLTKMSRQLQVSMGSMAYLVDGFAIVLFVVLIYLLSKVIIEKNAQSISMAKILGYTNGEVARLYLLPTTVVVVVFLGASLPIVENLMRWIFRAMLLSEMTGWLPFILDATLYPTMMAMGLVTYGVVAALEYRRIRRIPMDVALKNVE